MVDRVKDAGTVVFVGGISPDLEGEEKNHVNCPGFCRRRPYFYRVPQVQRDILKALKAAGKKVVFVNCSGSAMALVPELIVHCQLGRLGIRVRAGGLAVAERAVR